jgi:hypothetical protein
LNNNVEKVAKSPAVRPRPEKLAEKREAVTFPSVRRVS